MPELTLDRAELALYVVVHPRPPPDREQYGRKPAVFTRFG
jgi:hypothetical protein